MVQVSTSLACGIGQCESCLRVWTDYEGGVTECVCSCPCHSEPATEDELDAKYFIPDRLGAKCTVCGDEFPDKDELVGRVICKECVTSTRETLENVESVLQAMADAITEIQNGYGNLKRTFQQIEGIDNGPGRERQDPNRN